MHARFNAAVFKKEKEYEYSQRPLVKKLLNKISSKWGFNDDLDFQLTMKVDGYIYLGGKKYWFDVKNTKKEYPRIFCETTQFGNKNNGWVYTNQDRKNILIIYCMKMANGGLKAIIFLLHRLRKYIEENRDKYYFDTSCGSGFGYLVPIKDLKKSISAYEVTV